MERRGMFQRDVESNEDNKDNVEIVVEEARRTEEKFKEFFGSRGLLEIDAVSISSDIDPTVRFIGSHISVFKPFLQEKQLPEDGIYMVQDCVRTRNSKKLLDDEFLPAWGSYFRSLGVLVPAKKLEDLSKMTIDYLVNSLGVSTEDILVRVSSGDQDLLSVAKLIVDEQAIEVDTKDEKYYRHKIGMENVSGRNFNIALRGKNDEFSDVGNIILLEKDGVPHSVELALGISTIVKQTKGVEHVLDVTPVAGLNEIKDISPEQSRKFQDCIIFSVALFQEGLRPMGGKNKNRILKKYTQALSYYRLQLGLSLEEISEIIASTSNNVANSDIKHTASIITEYLRCYEKELETKKNLGKDDKKILELLNSK